MYCQGWPMKGAAVTTIQVRNSGTLGQVQLMVMSTTKRASRLESRETRRDGNSVTVGEVRVGGPSCSLEAHWQKLFFCSLHYMGV